MHNYLSGLKFFTRYTIAVLGTVVSIAITLLTIGMPYPAYAIQSVDCPTGTTLEIVHDESTAQLNDYMLQCSDKSQNFIITNIPGDSCPAGYKKESRLVQESICVRADVSTKLTTLVGASGPTCSGGWSNLLNPGVCITRSLFAGIGSLFMGLGITLVTLAGNLFEYVMTHAIVQFATTLASIQDGISTGWSAFRDIANIVIIGVFVFTAINIILGVKEYGEKKTIAKVLIIAVLINFSLLFTKIIIDASNFTAYQFYNSMVKGQESTSPASPSTSATDSRLTTADIGKGPGIGARFMQLLGVQGIGDSYNMLRKIQEGQDDAFLGLVYGFLSFVFLLAVAAVFFYGAFLIVTRAVLLVFLMLTSAIAFASWLVPYHIVQESWKKWWETLIKAAIFGPILMIFLWMTAMISARLAHTGEGTLGALASNASSQANVAALFSFALILGLLFASFKAASGFASSIAGFNMAGAALKLSAGIPFALGGRLAGFAGRNLIGRGAARYGKGVGADIGKTRDMIAKVPKGVNFSKRREFLTERLRNLEATKKSADWVAKQGFSIAGTGVGKELLKKMGVPSLIGGGKVESFGDRAKKVSEDAAKRAVEATRLSEKQQASIRESAEKRAENEHAAKKTGLEKTHGRARGEKDTAAAELGLKVTAHEAEKQKRKEIEEEIAVLKEAVKSAPSGSKAHKDLAGAGERLKVQDAIIESAHKAVKNLEEEAATKKDAFDEAQATLEKHNTSLERTKREAGDTALLEATSKLDDAAQALATRIASGRTSRILKLGMDPDNSHISQLAREKTVPQIKSWALRKRRLVEKEVDKELGLDDESKSSGKSAPESPKKP